MPTLQNDQLSVTILPYGARIQSIRLADGWEAVLGLKDEAAYRDDPMFHGAALGRYANRIRGGFTLDGERHELPQNNGPNCLHGGPGGFQAKHWSVEHESDDCTIFSLSSPDGDQGFPGQLDVRLEARIDGARLRLSFEARTDRPTPVNLSYHPYFRLGGDTVRDHILRIEAMGVLQVDEDLVPTGEIMPLVGGALDLREGGELGRHIDALNGNGGFDHCFTWAEGVSAELSHPGSGRRMRVTSNAPMMQVYTGQGLVAPHAPYAGVALEPQSAPDAPNQPRLGSTILRPGGTYRRWIAYEFLKD